jgi:hypothetical protein
VHHKIADFDAYNSDRDPSFIVPSMSDPESSCEESSDEEVPEEEEIEYEQYLKDQGRDSPNISRPLLLDLVAWLA